MRGAVALQTLDDPICIAVAGPGDTLGEASLADISSPTAGRWLTPGTVLELSAGDVRAETRAEALLPAVLAATMRRHERVQRQTLCIARHMASSRLARLMLAIHRASGERTIAVTQLELATMMGLQRTSVNGAVAALHKAGAVKVIRGRFSIADVEALERTACCP